MNFVVNLTWMASLLCSIGMCLSAITALRNPNHIFLQDPFFLPLYFAGIVQWMVWGLRIDEAAIVYPCLPQILILSPLIYRWYQRRIQ